MTKIFVLLMFSCINLNSASAQQKDWKVRIANIVIDSAYLHDYGLALAEHAQAAVTLEPGVLALNAVYNKTNPTHVTVFEVYASDSAYQQHIKTGHFLKYKNGTSKMVKSLELIDVTPIALMDKLADFTDKEINPVNKKAIQ